MKGARLMCELFFKKERCCQSVTCIQPEHLERSDTNQLRQSGDVPLSGCFQELLLPPPRLSSLCSCTHQTLFENKGSWSTVMRSHQPLKKNKKNLPSFHTLQHCNDFIIFCDIFRDLSRSIDYVGAGIIPQQQQNDLLKGPKWRKKEKYGHHLSSLTKASRGEKGKVYDSDSKLQSVGWEEATSQDTMDKTGPLIL